MIYWRNNKISDKQQQVAILLYSYRGLTNEHLRRLIFGHLSSDNNGQKANISRYTAALRKIKLIESFSCYPFTKELIHCLTSKGIEFVKEQVIIDPENEKAGFDGKHFGDFSATLLKPGIKNLEHTMMFLEFAIKYKSRQIRHNLYAVREYHYIDKTSDHRFYEKLAKVRPDGEMIGKKGELLCIEIDTGSERYEQLLLKFENYKRYFDFCITNDFNIAWDGMAFVCKESSIDMMRDQRLHTIIRAACEGLQYYVWDFNVQIINRGGKGKALNMSLLLKHYPEILDSMSIPLPQKINHVLEKKKEDEENKKREEAEAESIRINEQLRVENMLKQQQLEFQKREENRIRRELEETKSKKRGLIGKLFG